MNSPTTPSHKASSREWIGLAVLTLPCLLVAMDLTVLNLAVPHLSADLKPSSSQLLWIVDIYGFLISGSLITMGTLGDRIGRRRLLLIGACVFGLTSLMAAFSTTAEMLIASRALLGISGATLAPSTLSLIRNMFHDPKQFAVAIGIWITSFTVGGTIGPLIGGALLEHYWWGSVFLPNVPVMILLLVLGPILLPEFKDAKAGRLDLLSAGMSLAGVLSVIYGLKKIAEEGWHIGFVGSIVAGLVIGYLFLLRQKKLKDPLVDINLFRSAAFSTSLAANTLTAFASFGLFILVAQFFQLVLGMTPLEAGLWSLPSSIGTIVGSLVAPAIVTRVRPAYVMSGGLFLSSLGFFVISFSRGAHPLLATMVGILIYSIGLTQVFALSTNIIVSSVPPEKAGSASSLSETSAELGGALGIAILGSISTAIYRREVAETVHNIPSDVLNAARSTLGAAAAAAESLPSDLAKELLTHCREAFMHSYQVVSYIDAVLALVLAVLVAYVLRDSTNQPGGGH